MASSDQCYMVGDGEMTKMTLLYVGEICAKRKKKNEKNVERTATGSFATK